MTSSFPAPGIYRHYKGALYRVLGHVQHSETLEILVFYQALYGDFGFWVRPVAMFGMVEVEGKQVPRFSLESPAPGLASLVRSPTG